MTDPGSVDRDQRKIDLPRPRPSTTPSRRPTGPGTTSPTSACTGGSRSSPCSPSTSSTAPSGTSSARPRSAPTGPSERPRVIDVERSLGLFVEENIQDVFLGYRFFLQFWNVFYGTFHFWVTGFALIYLFRKQPARYSLWRNTIVFATLLALIGFSWFPLMPPRLLDDCGQFGACASYGFVDTLASYGGLWSFDSGAMEQISNQYAAMPSLHFAWALWAFLVLYPHMKHRWSRIAIAAYPWMTLFAIIVTANHYWLDALGGALALRAATGSPGPCGRRSAASVTAPRRRRRPPDRVTRQRSALLGAATALVLTGLLAGRRTPWAFERNVGSVGLRPARLAGDPAGADRAGGDAAGHRPGRRRAGRDRALPGRRGGGARRVRRLAGGRRPQGGHRATPTHAWPVSGVCPGRWPTASSWPSSHATIAAALATVLLLTIARGRVGRGWSWPPPCWSPWPGCTWAPTGAWTSSAGAALGVLAGVRRRPGPRTDVRLRVATFNVRNGLAGTGGTRGRSAGARRRPRFGASTPTSSACKRPSASRPAACRTTAPATASPGRGARPDGGASGAASSSGGGI